MSAVKRIKDSKHVAIKRRSFLSIPLSNLISLGVAALVVKLVISGLFVFAQKPATVMPILSEPLALAKDDAPPKPDQEVAAPLSKKIDGTGKPANSSSIADLQALELERAKLKTERLLIDEERKRLNALKDETGAKLAELARLQQTMQKQVVDKKSADSQKIQRLIKIYTAMPPKKAAALIDKLDMSVIISLFSNMKGETVGQILPFVSADKAAQISEQLAKGES